jgi:peptidoglycan/LPS O-acetylase OafA/YrhL
MNQLNELGVSLFFNIIISVSSVFLIAWLIFKYIENPSQLLLRNMFERVSGKNKILPNSLNG